jgi:hypothetical protein
MGVVRCARVLSTSATMPAAVRRAAMTMRTIAMLMEEVGMR